MGEAPMKKHLRTFAGIFAGNVSNALAVAAFIVPNSILIGGSTGISLTLQHAFGLELTVTVFAFNVLFFVLGAWVLGKKFALSTVASTLLYPALLALFQRIPGIDALTENDLLAAIFAGLLLGIGIGLIVRQGASTGGTDILAMVLNKFTHAPVAVLLYVVDFIVLGMQAFFCTSEQILYGVLSLLITTAVMNQVVLFGQAQLQLLIVSEKYEALREKLLRDLDVGVSMIYIETGLGKKRRMAVLCVIPQRKLYAANELIRQIDVNAFTMISRVKEVKGRGFSLERVPATQETQQNEELS
jgi:uncharacterized membrane-anchored protein YitT (DUF2179 family)